MKNSFWKGIFSARVFFILSRAEIMSISWPANFSQNDSLSGHIDLFLQLMFYAGQKAKYAYLQVSRYFSPGRAHFVVKSYHLAGRIPYFLLDTV